VWTIEGWFRLDTTGGNRCLFAYDGNDSLSAADIYMYWSGTAVRFNIGGGASEAGAAITDMEDGAFHHIVLSQPGGATVTATTYEDGALADEITGMTRLNLSGYAFHLGDNYNISHWLGMIGEVRIYNRALTLLEIQHNYMATKARYQ